jgi:hypothetical protein
MASVVDVCNLALAHLGDDATVSSIDPPEGSAQAEHCKRFYAIARDTLLQLHNWNFASKRVALAQVTNPTTQWDYAYAVPSDCSVVISVLASDSIDDYSGRMIPTDTPYFPPVVAAGMYMPQPYCVEVDTLGNKVIYTNQETATLRYQALITDSAKFDALFVITLSWHLASMLAGPIIKGDAGSAEAKRCIQMMGGYLQTAKASDSNQRNIKPEHIVSWTAGR